MLRDFGLLDSAVMRPQATAFGADAYPSLHEKAGALLQSLARNHPFVDGNKRTAWATTEIFYQLNGHVLSVDDDQIVGLVIDVAEGFADVPHIAGRLKEWATPFPTPDEWIDLEDGDE
jgi:death-on-curing protein